MSDRDHKQCQSCGNHYSFGPLTDQDIGTVCSHCGAVEGVPNQIRDVLQPQIESLRRLLKEALPYVDCVVQFENVHMDQDDLAQEIKRNLR